MSPTLAAYASLVALALATAALMRSDSLMLTVTVTVSLNALLAIAVTLTLQSHTRLLARLCRESLALQAAPIGAGANEVYRLLDELASGFAPSGLLEKEKDHEDRPR